MLTGDGVSLEALDGLACAQRRQRLPVAGLRLVLQPVVPGTLPVPLVDRLTVFEVLRVNLLDALAQRLAGKGLEHLLAHP